MEVHSRNHYTLTIYLKLNKKGKWIEKESEYKWKWNKNKNRSCIKLKMEVYLRSIFLKKKKKEIE